MEAAAREEQHQQEQPPAPGPGPSSEQQKQEQGKQQFAQLAKFVPKRNRGNIRKRTDEEQAAGGGNEGGEEGEGSAVRQAKVSKTGEPLTFTSNRGPGADEVHVTYESSRAIQSGKDNKVTSYLETETDINHDARALREARLRQGQEGQPISDGKYRGMNNYIDYRAGFRSEASIASEKGRGAMGPLRASMYVRSTSIMDYNPSICKDYKETGFCSYGDSCKFMHDRGDYKMSWELDREWEEEQKAKAEQKMRLMERRAGKGSDEEDSEEEEDDDLPFACYICREPWGQAKNPVVTRCKHYFCEKCALKHNAKTSKCAVCEQQTQGIFNVAHEILKKMKKVKGQ